MKLVNTRMQSSSFLEIYDHMYGRQIGHNYFVFLQKKLRKMAAKDDMTIPLLPARYYTFIIAELTKETFFSTLKTSSIS